MNLENSVSDIKKCTVEKVAVIFKWEAGKVFAKDVKTDTNTQMKPSPAQQADEEGEDIYSISILAEKVNKAT